MTLVLKRGSSKIAVRFVAWATFFACIGWLSVAFQNTWRATGEAGSCGNGADLTTGEDALWVLAATLATVLLAFLTNRWLAIGLGFLGFLVAWGSSFGLALALLFGSCGTATPALPWFATFFAGVSLAAGAALAIPIWLIPAAVSSYLRMRGARTGRAWARELGISVLLLVAAGILPIALVALGWMAWTGRDLEGLTLYGSLSIGFLALVVGALELTGISRKTKIRNRFVTLVKWAGGRGG